MASLEEARAKLDEARKLVSEGKNPREIRREQKLALKEGEKILLKHLRVNGMALNQQGGLKDMLPTSWRHLKMIFSLCWTAAYCGNKASRIAYGA